MRIFMGGTPEALSRQACELLKAPSEPCGAGASVESALAMLSAERDPVVVCPNAAVRTWLQNALTREDGVLAGLKWLHPSELLRQLLQGDIDSDLLGERAVWVLYDQLRAMRPYVTHPRLRTLGGYSEKDLFGFARRVKDALASYAAYRPEWVAAWLNGKDPKDEITDHRDYAWQRDLFRALRARGFSGLDTIRRAAEGGFSITEEWRGRRVLVFMPETMPPLLERGLRALETAGAQVSLFALAVNEAPDGLFEVKATKTRRDLLKRFKTMGNIETLPAKPREEGVLPPHAKTDNLERIRAAFSGTAPEAPASESGAGAFDYDESLAVVCSTDLVRSVETFADRLELLFKADPTLKPHDVMLLFPRPAEGASAVRAVFDRRRAAVGGSASLIPYRNYAEGEATGVETAMLEALRLVSEKCTFQRWNAWFSSPALLDALRLTRKDAETARAWLARAGFVFGIDRAHLAARMKGVAEPEDSGTLECALGRLACGAIFSEGRRSPFADGTLPLRADDVDFDVPPVHARQDLLEKLVGIGAFLSTLSRETERREGDFASSWQPLLVDAAQTLFGASSSDTLREELARWKRLLERLAFDLRETSRRTGDASKVVVKRDVVLAALGVRTKARGAASRPADVVTVGGLRELCTVPARVVAVFGLDANCGLPVSRARPEFDLLAFSIERGARPGDPDPEAEDWTVFGLLLENARDVLHLAYERRNDTTGKPVDDPSPAVSDLLRYSASVLGVCRQTGERGIPVVVESPSSADPTAFRSGLSPAGEVLGILGRVPLRSWRALDAALCEALKKSANAVSKGKADGALRVADALPAAFTDGYARSENGAYDLSAVLRWFARPVAELRRALGIVRADASELSKTEESAFVIAAPSALLEAKLLQAYTRAIERGETRRQIEERLAADPQLGFGRLSAREAQTLCEGFERAADLVDQAQHALLAEGALTCALCAQWTWAGETVCMRFPRVWMTPEKLVLVRERLSAADDAKSNAAALDVFEAAALLAALRTGALAIEPDRERSVEDTEALRSRLAALSAAAPEASPKRPGPFVELVLVARESGQWAAETHAVTLGAKTRSEDWTVAPPEALLEALFRAFLAARRVPALHVFDAYVSEKIPPEFTPAAQFLASLAPELEVDERVRLSKDARERFIALNKALLAKKMTAKSRSAALEQLLQFESSARTFNGENA